MKKFESNDGTLQEAKDFLKNNWKVGVECPCCKQFVKLYATPFNSNMAIFLISLVLLYQKNKTPIHYKKCKFSSRNYPHLAKWNLMVTDKSETADKKTSGFWTPTQLGIDFVNNKCSVKSKAYIYNNNIYGFGGDDINIVDALGNKFNYQKLMNDYQ
jgi:hypothetical protein